MAIDVIESRGELVQSGGAAVRVRPLVPVLAPAPGTAPAADWREGLPTLRGEGVVLRDLRVEDAAHLAGLLTEPDVLRFLTPPPQTAAGFRRFVRWAQRKRTAGQYACFAVVPRGGVHAVGFFQLRATDGSFDTAEWGFVLGRPYWGTGLFAEGAALLMNFAFGELGVRRLEARAVSANGRANGALRKVGAVAEGVLRASLTIDGRHLDTTLWSLLRSEWQTRTRASRRHVRRSGAPLVLVR